MRRKWIPLFAACLAIAGCTLEGKKDEAYLESIAETLTRKELHFKQECTFMDPNNMDLSLRSLSAGVDSLEMVFEDFKSARAVEVIRQYRLEVIPQLETARKILSATEIRTHEYETADSILRSTGIRRILTAADNT